MVYDNLIGQTFGRLTVTEPVEGRTKDGGMKWGCLCICGTKVIVTASNLRKGNTSSCGCLRKERARCACTKHGLSARKNPHPAYNTWRHMKNRCDCETSDAYAFYGGRGITYDKKWKTFEGFWEDMGPTWERGLSIDRIDNDGNYTKENCRWATRKEQARNTRWNHRVFYKGETRCLSEWCDILGLRLKTVDARIRKCGWTVEKSFETP